MLEQGKFTLSGRRPVTAFGFWNYSWHYLKVLREMATDDFDRVPTVREKSVKNEKNSRSGKSQGILSWVREI